MFVIYFQNLYRLLFLRKKIMYGFQSSSVQVTKDFLCVLMHSLVDWNVVWWSLVQGKCMKIIVCIICTCAKVTVKPLKRSYEISGQFFSHSSENMGKSWHFIHSSSVNTLSWSGLSWIQGLSQEHWEYTLSGTPVYRRAPCTHMHSHTLIHT